MTQATFGKYQVLEKIGEGGFGEVFKGLDSRLNRYVAIKTCNSMSDELRQRFLREAEIGASLQHPNIITVFEFDYQDATPYLVQEYLSGEDLDHKIRRRDALDIATRLSYLLQVASGLRHAHDQGVIHRDVKPANIRVLEDGLVKIMDFGIAKLLTAEHQLTRTGMTLGTAAYLPPEQIRGQRVDPRADIFSFGVLAYELLTYARPFNGDSLSSILYAIAHQDPAPLTDSWPMCPAPLAAMIDRCLKKEAVERYPSFSEVIPVLDTLLRSTGEIDLTRAAGLAAPPPLPPEPRVTPLPATSTPPPTATTPIGGQPADPQATRLTAGKKSPGGPGKVVAMSLIVLVMAAVGVGLWFTVRYAVPRVLSSFATEDPDSELVLADDVDPPEPPADSAVSEADRGSEEPLEDETLEVVADPKPVAKTERKPSSESADSRPPQRVEPPPPPPQIADAAPRGERPEVSKIDPVPTDPRPKDPVPADPRPKDPVAKDPGGPAPDLPSSTPLIVRTPYGYNQGTLNSGQKVYGDRNFTFGVVPREYRDLVSLRTFNDNKTKNIEIRFAVGQTVDVFVAHDRRVKRKPTWLSSFRSTGQELSVNEVGRDLNTTVYDVYVRRFRAGEVVLGPNMRPRQSKQGASMYIIFLRPQGP